MLKYINVPVFLLTLFIGLFCVYIIGPEIKTVYIYPSPEFIDSIILQDKSNNCFNYVSSEIKCPSNDNELSVIPIQA
jgi:hypothetical protein